MNEIIESVARTCRDPVNVYSTYRNFQAIEIYLISFLLLFQA